MTSTHSPIWFQEPLEPDDTWGEDGEKISDWLLRSTKPRAREARRFLNENLARLPPEVQKTLVRELRHRWSSAFFELVVMRLLQEWGAELEIEIPNQEGRRPDVLAKFADAQLVVEATSPVYNEIVLKEMDSNQPLVRIAEQLCPDGYRLGVKKVPNLGPGRTRKEFTNSVRELVAPFHFIKPEEIPMEGVDLCSEISSGVIHLRIFPVTILVHKEGNRDKRAIFGPIVSYMDNSQHRIRRSFDRKRPQVRSSTAPVLLVIDGGCLSADIQDFDEALIGRGYVNVGKYGSVTSDSTEGFVLDGKLYENAKSEKPPTYAAVLMLVT